MSENYYLKPAWTHNSSVRTDLPLMVFAKAKRKKLATAIRPGQLCCVGKVYLKTNNNLITQTDRILIENQRKYLFDNNILHFVIPVKTGIQFAQNFNRFPPARE